MSENSVNTKEKAKFILTEHKNGGWMKVDSFELHLTGEEQLLCYIIWQTRHDIIKSAEESIRLKFTFKEPIFFPGIGREQLVNIGSPVIALAKDWAMHPRDFVQEGNAEQRAKALAFKPELIAFRIPRDEGMSLFACLIWVCNSTGAKPEEVSAGESNNKPMSSMQLFDSVISDNLRIIPEKIIARGFNKLQLKIIRTIIEKMQAGLPKGSPAYEDWKHMYEVPAGEKIFQIQELIMQCFPDPLDKMREKELANAAQAIAAKKESSKEENATLW